MEMYKILRNCEILHTRQTSFRVNTLIRSFTNERPTLKTLAFRTPTLL